VKSLKPYLLFLIILIVSFTIDIVSKYLLVGVDSTLIPSVLSFRYYRNYGIAFGWLSGGGVWLAILSAILIIIASGYYVWQRREFHKQGKKSHPLFDIGFALFIGGALGNLFDRVFLGYVRDFVQLDFIRFPIFNFADVFINVGLVLIIIYVLFIMSRDERKARKKHAKD